MTLGNRIVELENGERVVDLGRGRIYLGKEGGKGEIFLTRDEFIDLCQSFLLMGYSKELRRETEPLFDLLAEAEADWEDGAGVLKLENGRLMLGYRNVYKDITEIARKEDFDFYRFAHDIGLERTGLCGGEAPYDWRNEEPEKVSLRKKLGALGIIGLITGIAGGLGMCYGLGKGYETKNVKMNTKAYDDTKNAPVKLNKKDEVPRVENNSAQTSVSLEELALRNDPKEIKKYIWPLFCEEVSGSTHASRDEYFLFLPQDDKYIRIQFKNKSSAENFLKGMDAAGIPYETVTYADLCKKMNIPPQLLPVLDFIPGDDPERIHSVLIPVDDFFQHKQELIKLLNETSGVSENTVAEDVDKLERRKIANSVTPTIAGFEALDVENATLPSGDALQLQKKIQNFTDKDYDVKIWYLTEVKNAPYNETDFDALVKTKLKEEGYTIEDLNNMSTKDVLKVLAKLVEDSVEYDKIRADAIVEALESGNVESIRYYTPYETLTRGKAVCSDYSLAYEGVIRILRDDVPKLKRVIVVGNRGNLHEWNVIIYFDGKRMVIVPVDLTWDDSDGIAIGAKTDNGIADFSAIDQYHVFSKK